MASSASRSKRTRIPSDGATACSDCRGPALSLAGSRCSRRELSARSRGTGRSWAGVQVVRVDVLESSQGLVEGIDKAPAGHHEWVDGPPQLRGLGVPFTSFGMCPTLFDAPASTESDTTFGLYEFE